MTDNQQAVSNIHNKLDAQNEKAKHQEDVSERLDKIVSPKVEDKQPEPTPSSSKSTEQPKTEAKAEEVRKDVTSPTEDVDEQEALANSKNPERTKKYIDSLKEKLKEKETPIETPEVDLKEFGSVFDGVYPAGVPATPTNPYPTVPQQPPTPYLQPNQQQNIVQQFIDPQGNVDVQGLNNALISANRQAYEAKQSAQNTELKIAQIEQNNQNREMKARFPEMDPIQKDKFDPMLFNAVKDRLVRNMWEGKRKELVDVVSDIVKERGVQTKQEEKQVEEKQQVAQEQRRQGPLESGGGERKNYQEPSGNVRSRSLNDKTMSRGALNDPNIDSRLNDYFKTQ